MTAEMKEAIARLIDPWAYSLKGDPRVAGILEEVYTKADAILALLSAPQDRDVGDFEERLKELFTAAVLSPTANTIGDLRSLTDKIVELHQSTPPSVAVPEGKPIGFVNVYADKDGDLELGCSDPYATAQEAKDNAVPDEMGSKYLGIGEVRLLSASPSPVVDAGREQNRFEADAERISALVNHLPEVQTLPDQCGEDVWPHVERALVAVGNYFSTTNRIAIKDEAREEAAKEIDCGCESTKECNAIDCPRPYVNAIRSLKGQP